MRLIKKDIGLDQKAFKNNSLSGRGVTVAIAVVLALLMALTAIPTGVSGAAGTVGQIEIVNAEEILGAPEAPVNLGSAANFVILSKAGITTTGVTSIVGNIGVSPIGSTAITGFDLILDPSTEFATSSLIDGKVYASDYTEPTPSMLTTAIGDMQDAYTDAAGRTTPDVTELGAGEIGGLTLAPGLYKWGTSVDISTDVTISGSASEVWIFQVGIDLNVANGVQIILDGGANQDNIFWQVPGITTLGTTSVFYGNILCQTAIVLNTGATLNGRALAQTEVTTDANPITVPIDSVLPFVSSTDPVNNETDVAVNSAISATFNKIMDPTTMNATSFTLVQGVTPISGIVNHTGVTAVFTPDSDLAASTEYTATITTGAMDLAGNALSGNYSWNFTTGEYRDTTAPTVTSTVPANAAIGIAINSALSATFSEPMNPLTLTTTTFKLEQGTTVVMGTVTFSGVTAMFNPVDDLAVNTLYNVTITTGVKDLAGNALGFNKTWSFTTSAAPDIIAPTVISAVPADGASDVAINSAIAVTFSEPMNPLTMNTVTFTLEQGLITVAGTVAYFGMMAVFTPAIGLAVDTNYTAKITTGVKDLAGNAMVSNYTWNFTTSAVPDASAPSVILTVPTTDATDVTVDGAITATFSEPISPLTISTATFLLMQGSTAVAGSVNHSGVNAVFTPDADLLASTIYTAKITTGVKDLAGNSMVSNYTWSFTTSAAPDIIAPTVISVVPMEDASDVSFNGAITATFSEPMDPLTISTATFLLMQGSTAVAGSVNHSGVNAVFTPDADLLASTIYTAKITTGVKDLAGNSMVSNYTWSFTTSAVPDTVAPVVILTAPTTDATDVAVDGTITVTFGEAMDPLTFNTTTFKLMQGTTAVEGTVTYSGMTAVFTPTEDLEYGEIYSATITTGVEDLAGNALASDHTWSFTTEDATDDEPFVFPLWAIILIVLGIAGVIGVIIYRAVRKPSKR